MSASKNTKNISLSYWSLVLSVIIGSVVVVSFAWTTGNLYGTSLMPTVAILSGFIVTGMVIGFFSKGITIIEPGLGSVVVAVPAYFILSGAELRAFADLQLSDWFLILLNAVLLTFAGAWLGEKLQNGIVKPEESAIPNFELGWVMAGALLGITVSLVLVNLLVLVIGPDPDQFVLPFFVSLFVTGIIVGWLSPGITVIEAGFSGFVTIVALLDISKLTLFIESSIPLEYIVAGLILGFIVTLIGGYIGEKIQGYS